MEPAEPSPGTKIRTLKSITILVIAAIAQRIHRSNAVDLLDMDWQSIATIRHKHSASLHEAEGHNGPAARALHTTRRDDQMIALCPRSRYSTGRELHPGRHLRTENRLIDVCKHEGPQDALPHLALDSFRRPRPANFWTISEMRTLPEIGGRLSSPRTWRQEPSKCSPT